MSLPSTIRPRINGKSSAKDGKAPSRYSNARQQPNMKFSVLDVIRVIGGLALLSTILSYILTGTSFWFKDRPLWSNPQWLRWRILGDLQLTPAELAQYDGTNGRGLIYLAFNGTIYDVSASPHFYGPGGGYHDFAGVDATRAFITGCFAEDRTDDLRGVEEMYMPMDLDNPPELTLGMDEEDRKEARRVWKNRKAQANKLALEKVRSGVEEWEQSFQGSKGKYGSMKTKYFRVGTVRFSEEDLKARKARPKPTLCNGALGSRPTHAAELGIS